MKCPKCRNRIKVELGDTDIQIDNANVHVTNIPVFVCPSCGERMIHDILIERTKAYATKYGVKENTLDFGRCEEWEGAESIVTMQTLGIL